MDRRTSEDRTPRHSENPNVFDDEFAVDPDESEFMPAVSDGFRPVGVDQRRSDPDREPAPRPSLSISKPSDPNAMRRIASRNSTAKTPFAQEHVDARAAASNHNRGAGAQGAGLQHRESVSSNGSFATMARSESPFGAAPSHPYGMYAQNTALGRSASVTTSSTLRQAHRPAHPYGMYTQNVVEDSEEPPLPTAAPAIPVGFPGRLNTGYHRRIGPDGEEQDIVGPDGHMEQLPPYSRYPEEGPTKAALAAGESATPVDSPVTGAMAIPVSPPAAPQVNASEDRLLSPTRQNTQTEELSSRHVSSGPPSTAEQPLSEKRETKKKGWSNWGSRRLWGKIPLGVVVILLILVLIFAIVLGAAIGSFVAKDKMKHKKPDNKGKGGNDPEFANSPSLSFFDASPIPVPSGLPSLPQGSFALPLGFAQESSPSCLTVANQLSAWSCKSMIPLLLTVNTSSIAGGNKNTPYALIAPFTKPDGGIQYGVQAPSLQPQPLQLVLDQDYRAFGPAWHFQSVYDKVVILDQEEFSAGASVSKRQDPGPPNKSGDPTGGFRHRFQVLPGDSPWYCIWNSTFIEGYIYVKDNSTAATMTNIPTAWPSSNPFVSSDPAAASSTPANAVASSTGPRLARQTSPSRLVKGRGDGDYPKIPAYPRIVKIEERRLPNSPKPYCQKMQLMDSGQLVPARTSNEQLIKIQLQETDPSMEDFRIAAAQPPPQISGDSTSSASSPSATGRGKRDVLDKRRDPAGACHCQWMFQ